MCDEGGFEGWNGKWKNSASMFDLYFVLSNPVVFFHVPLGLLHWFWPWQGVAEWL